MLDTSTWKEFVVSDILNVEQTKSIVAKANLKEGDIPYVSRTTSNNGYQSYCGNKDKVNKGNCITIGAETAIAFYQPKDFVAGNKVYRLSKEGLSEKHYIFLASVLNKKTDDYSYSNARIPAKIKAETMLLPSRHPADWTEFNVVICKFFDELSKQTNLPQSLLERWYDYMKTIDTSKWEEFRLCDLFEKIAVEKIKGKANDFPMSKNEEFCIPLLTAGADNQGFARYARRTDCPTILKNVISISANGANTGITFYQDDEFAVLQDAYAIRLIGKEIQSKEVGLFLAAAINKAIRDNHDWSNKAGWNNIKTDKIKLPIIENEWEPDWAFMEQYIAELEEDRVAELEKYLIATGLNDYELTDEDKAVLCASDEKYIEKYVGDVIWKKIKIGDIFDSQSGDFDIKKEHINNKGIPVVSSGVADRGLIGKTDIKAKEFKARTLTVDMFGNAFYRDEPYKMVTHARVFSMTPKFNIDDKIGEYLETKLKFLNTMFEYNNMCSFKKIQNLELELPFDKNGNLHTVYIYIYTSYRKNGHQGSCSLDEKRVRDVAKDCLKWKEFRIGSLFDVINNPQLDKENFTFGDSSKYPYFTRTENNNGILGYVDYLDDKHKIQGNSLAVGMISMKFHYMEHDFYAGQFTKTLIPKFDEFNETLASYFITLLNKHTPIYQAELVRHFANLVKETSVKLPVLPDGTPDFEYMEKYIRTIEKLTIQGVVEWKDEEIEITRKIINK